MTSLKPIPLSPRGTTLVIILLVLLLFAFLVLAMFYTAQSSRKSSSSFADSIKSRFLSDAAVNLAIAQISDATRQPGSIWVSQPGLIRTFSGNHQPLENYRLYSWSSLRVSGKFDPFAAANQVPSDWASLPALYVDLNEPVPDLDAPQDTSRDRYPILYPPDRTQSGANKVAGYSIRTNSVGATVSSVPMPVQWLYMLQDGSIKAPQVQGDGAVRIPGATEENPISGRIAFWADDESSKVNINTAAGGLFWTEPRFETREERNKSTQYPDGTFGLGLSQPVKNEFQRYPGHPARTDLRAVFPELTWEEIYQLAPRVNTGGSNNGTTFFPQNQLSTKGGRLFADLGELIFSTEKTGATTPRQEKFAGSTLGWESLVEQRKGFLTTSSRAPELNLLGLPRISVWPISGQSDQSYLTALDRLAAFCATVGSGTGAQPYYFTRTSPYSASADIQQSRNQELYRYLQNLTGQSIPGYGSASFQSKYGAHERDQILTEVFDYIRSINLQDMQLPANRRFAPDAFVVPTKWNPGSGETQGFGRTRVVRQAGFIFICTGDQAEPRSNRAPGETAGNEYKENLSLADYDAGGKLQPNERRVQALFVVELFSPSAGFKMFLNSPVFTVEGLEDMTLSTADTASQNLGFPGGETPPVSTANGSGTSYNGGFGADGGALNYRWFFQRSNSSGVQNIHPLRPVGRLEGNVNGYPFVSVPVTLRVDPANPEMTLSAGTIRIRIYSSSAQTYLMGEVEMNLDEVTLPVPRLHAEEKYWAFHARGIYGDDSPMGRMAAGGPVNTIGDFIKDTDVVQTYILPHGDSRLLFSPGASGKSFVPAPPGTNPQFRHFLVDPGTTLMGANTQGRLVPGLTMVRQFAPAILPEALYPEGLNTPWNYGDWDTSNPMQTTDGALINRADEGSLFQLDSSAGSNPYAQIYSNVTAGGATAKGADYHSANRQIPSPVMLGSLPTGLMAGTPWQTLLFRPDPGGHPGANAPPDHLMLDFFWMPVVEPYAISEPFSTAGKVNLNYQMVPFTYVDRSTALHAVLQNEKIPAVSATWPSGYARTWSAPQQLGTWLFPVNVDETLRTFEEKFADGEVFQSASEITQVPLVPESAGVTLGSLDDFWEEHRATGDNLRERPYAHIYSRLTTKSNVFSVHYRVQTLKKVPDGDPEIWDESRDRVTSELRGSTLIERFIDMNDEEMPDFADPSSPNAEALYRFRILSTKDFHP